MTIDEFKQLFWLFFEELPKDVKTTIRAAWADWKAGDSVPLIFTEDAQIDGLSQNLGYSVDVATCGDHTFCFRLSRMRTNKASAPFIEVIYHELAHCYTNARGEFRPEDYIPNSTKWRQCEARAIRLSKRWAARLMTDAARVERLEGNSLIIRHSGVYNFAPLRLGS